MGRPIAAAAAFACGIVMADGLRPGPGVAAALGIAAVGLFVASFLRHRRNPEPATFELLPAMSGLTAAMLLTAFVLAGFSDGGFNRASIDGASLPRLDGRRVELSAIAASDSRLIRSATLTTLKKVRFEGRTYNEKLQLRVIGDRRLFEPGDRVRVTARVNRLDLKDPFDRALQRKGIVAEGTGSRAELIARTSNPFLRSANAFRRGLKQAVTTSLPRARGGLLLGLLIGDESRILESDVEALRSTGLAHLTAVSGSNVAMVLAATLALLSLFGLPRRTRIFAALAVLVFFTILTRWEPSVLRAVISASLALSAFLFGRKAQALNMLATAFLLLAAIDPMILWSIGFQLSFAATFGIVVLAPVIAARFERFPRLGEALGVAVAAQVAVTPLIALHFGNVSPLAVPANLLAFPFVAPATVLGLAGAAAGAVWDPLGRPLIELAGFAITGVLAAARVFATLPLSSVSVPRWSGIESAAFYLFVLSAAALFAGRKRAAVWPAGFAVVLLGAGIAIPVAASPTPNAAQVVFFDVGQGDSALVRSPRGATVLIDGGLDGRRVVRKLDRLGIRKIDLVVMSHAHLDHASGLEEVLGSMRVGAFLRPGTAHPLERKLAGIGESMVAEAGNRIDLADLEIFVLGPAPHQRLEVDPGGDGEGTTLNDASLVVRIEWKESCALFTGDVEEAGQQELLDKSRSLLRCDILKAPHHGSAKLLPEFVEAVDPEVVSVSVGPNTHGHPSRYALTLISDVGAHAMRTDRLGDYTVVMDGRGPTRIAG
ncbi:MAG TPA: ComEC/Rec2 family competence protein [Actinomycetota bacterium]|nr:ComEC/Rec2 family competence protein [Actinomycetota bacterium]